MLGLQAVEDAGSGFAALAQQAEEKVVFLRVMGPVDELLDVVEDRMEEGRIDRAAAVDLVGHEIHRGGDAPEILVFFGDDAQ